MNKNLKYKFNVVKNNVSIGGLRMKKIEVTKENKKKVNIESVKGMVDSLHEEASKRNEKIRILVQGVGELGANICLKGLNEESDLMLDRNQKYHNGMVDDPSKFTTFYNVGITILYDN